MLSNHDSSVTRIPPHSPTALCPPHNLITMPLSWKDNEQQCFFKVNLTSYVSSLEGGKLKDSFWPMITEKWFELWPLSEPSAELVKQQGLVEKAKKVLKMKNIEVSMT